jgi:cohesin complex subunit SCC1
MFYSHDILARKGPLGTIWIAAHLDRKLRKNQVLDTDIGISVEAILSADLQKVLALRLSGHLLLGITRIFNRKVTYLYGDCENALLKLKQAYKPGNVDLPKDEAMAPYNAITLPDNFELPELDNLSERWATPLLTRTDKYTTSKANITLEDRVTHDPFDISQDEVLPAGEALHFDQPLNCK